jgi:hypothetical protein
MAKFLQLALWNANGLAQHTEELRTFIWNQNINVLLISGIHLIENKLSKLPNYALYHTNYPAGIVWGATAMMITNSIKYHQLNKCSQNFLQAASMSVEDSVSLLTILSVYLPLRYAAKQEQLDDFTTL